MDIKRPGRNQAKDQGMERIDWFCWRIPSLNLYESFTDLQVYCLFKALVPDLGSSNRTSGLRKHAGILDYKDGNSLPDFTYNDREGKMAELLGLQETGDKTFHIEVKPSKSIEDSFAFSSRQLNTVSAAGNSLIVDVSDIDWSGFNECIRHSKSG